MALTLKQIEGENPFDLVEAEIYKTQSVTNIDFALGFDATFNEYRVYDPTRGQTIIIRLKLARVEVVTNACKISRQGRAGNIPRPTKAISKISRTETTSNESKIGGDASVEAGVSNWIPKLGLRLKGKGGATRSIVSTEKATEKEDGVRSSFLYVGNGKWVISDVFSAILAGRYTPEDHLCSIDATNEDGSIECRVYFYQEDMDIVSVSDTPIEFSKTSPKSALIKAMIAKGLSNLNESENLKDGRVVISVSGIEYNKATEDGSSENF